MRLAEIDRLNIIYFGEMELSDVEKKLRILMASELDKIAMKYINAILMIFDSNVSEDEKQAAYAACAAAFAQEYKRFFYSWYPRYRDVMKAQKGEGYPKTESWVSEHSSDVAVWLMNTTVGDPFEGYSNGRARSIIRTEINAIGNLIVIGALMDSGYTHKQWVTFGDSKVRATHIEAGGQIVPIDEPFTVGGYQLMFPQDSSLGAPPQEIVNCRCTMRGVKR